ncbi:MAG: hypothetical protein IKP00_08015 [Victivallales bacterium]|nr:hypothetical protein [Victivallales bacterium]
MKRFSFAIILFAAIFTATCAELKTLATWDFSQPLDSFEYPLKLRGNSKIENGMLISYCDDISKANGAVAVKNNKVFTPANAFSLTIDFMLNPELPVQARSGTVLWDSKYVFMPKEEKSVQHRGFALWIRNRGGNNYVFMSAFGFGSKSAQTSSKSTTITPNEKHTVKLLFSATGNVSYFLDGRPLGTVHTIAGPIAHSTYPPTLGDRHGSNFQSLGGGIAKVVLQEEEFTPVEIQADVYFRKVFERGEEAPTLHATMCNFLAEPLRDVTIQAETVGKKLPDIRIAEIKPSEAAKFALPLDKWLLHGTYTLECKAFDSQGKFICSASIPYTIVPEYGDFMPVLLWGGQSIEEVKNAGFTHKVCGIYPISGNFSQNSIPELVEGMDNNLANGLYVYTAIHSKYRFINQKRFLCKDRNGKEYSNHGLEASRPEVQEEFRQVAEDMSKYLGDHPAWDSTLLNSEIRGSARPSFTGVQEANFKKFAGYDIPADITGASPLPYSAIPDFPWDRIIDSKEPHFVYYNWFRQHGDGWNDVQSILSKAIHKYMKHHHFTFHDPAVRVLPQWGSGGDSDVISQWTYTYPDPIKIGQATDELFAMADGKPGQKVMKMTQAIWYRSATAPKGKTVANPPEWLSREKEAAFITIAPDFLREAIWSKISRPVQGIMYHGSGSLLAVENHGYRYTNPESKKVLADAVARVLRPLGPVLKRIPDRAPEVAILESATGWLYANKHCPNGWSNNWGAEIHLALQWANLQPSIIYEDHLLTNHPKLANLKVIVMPGAEVLTKEVLAKLQELQSKGVILVGDEYTAPALMVDFRIRSVPRSTPDPKGSKAAFQKLGNEIAAMLKPYYTAPMHASNNDLVMRRRGNDAADYLFVLNDKRTFGDYVGQWGLVMEKGLPNSGTVTVNHSSAAVYDLVKHQKVKKNFWGKDTSVDIQLGPGDGTLLLLLDREIKKVALAAPKEVARGAAFAVDIKVLDNAGKPIQAILPLEITLTDAAGTRLPGSGYVAAPDGAFTLNQIAATNMATGTVTMTVKDLASGLASTTTFTVK